MKTDRGFTFDPDAVEAAETGVLKAEALELATATEAAVVGSPECGTQCDCTGEPGEEGVDGLEGAVDIQVIDAINAAKGQMTEEQISDEIAALDTFREGLVSTAEAATEVAKSLKSTADAVAEMNRRAKLVAEKSSQKLVRELRKVDPKNKKTCAGCHVRVPLEVIGGGKSEMCDACLAAL